MAQGRSSASSAAIVALALLVFIAVQSDMVDAATYTVGGARGWTFNTVNWPNGKVFRAGDVLVFKYIKWFHSVVVVDKNGYDNCHPPLGAKMYRSGKDEIKLNKGQNYFICGVPGHCRFFRMKIAINAM